MEVFLFFEWHSISIRLLTGGHQFAKSGSRGSMAAKIQTDPDTLRNLQGSLLDAIRAVPDVHFRTVLRQEPDHRRSALMRGAVHPRVAIPVDVIDIASACEDELHGFQDLGFCSGFFLGRIRTH